MKFRVGSITGYGPVKTGVTYVYRQRYVPLDAFGRPGNPVKGLRAEFVGSPPTFDSQAAQIEFGWTDEERMELEGYLQRHTDFGRGLTLVDEDEAEEIATLASREGGSDRYCVFVTDADANGRVEVCGERTDGGDLCARHSREMQEVT